MTQPEKSVESALRTAFDHATPDVLENILSCCNEQEQPTSKGVLIMTENNNTAQPKKTTFRTVLGLAAALVVVLGGFGVYRTVQTGNAVAAIVGVDVNPSVELKLNNKEKVLEATAQNDDGVKILADMNLKGTDLNVAMRAVLGSMLEQGYVNELANSVLITVEPSADGNQATGAALEQRLAEQAKSILDSANVQASVLAQVLDGKDTEIETLAQANNISAGKAKLVQAVADVSPTKTFEDLSKLSINDLNLLASSKQADAAQMVVTGQASDKSYIGADKAKAAAFTAAGVADIANARVQMDFDDGRMYYEVEFIANDVKYEIDIDALTAQVYKIDRDRADWEDKLEMNIPAPANLPAEPKINATPNTANTTALITATEALNKALAHAGVTTGNAFDVDVELDYENGRRIYDVDFNYAGTEYTYYLDASTGEILYSYTEPDDDYRGARTNTAANPTNAAVSTASAAPKVNSSSTTKNDAVSSATQVAATSSTATSRTTNKAASAPVNSAAAASATTGTVTANTAFDKALAHAGVASANVYDRSVDLDYEYGKRVYDVEFKSAGTEYVYYIDAATGAILSNYTKPDDDYYQRSGAGYDDVSSATQNVTTPKPTTSTAPVLSTAVGISAQQALTIAQQHAGVANAYDTDVDLDYENGTRVYEVDFKSGNMEYSYYINANDGSILRSHKEYDD